jgi:hypothetical protein
VGDSSRAAEADGGRLYEVSRPDGADERAASRFASGAAGPGHLHTSGPADRLRVPPVVDQVLASGGTPLDAATRGVMEPRLGHNLADVRIHAGPDAALAARSVQARAFTAGSHVVLGATAPAAASPAGGRLLAHELTHVLQQAHGGFRLQRAGLEDDLEGGESSASGHPILDQMQVPPEQLVAADALERALGEALAADPSTRLPAPSPGDTDVGFTMAGPGGTGYALSFEYQPRPGGPGRLDLLSRTYAWTLSSAEQTMRVELTYSGSGSRAVRRVTVLNQLDQSGDNTIIITYDIKLDVPPKAETLTRHPSLTEVLGAPAAPEARQEKPVVPDPAAGRPADPTARVEKIPAPQDDETWWKELVAQLRSTVGAGLEHALGQVSGVALSLSGTFVDPALWATSPEAKRAVVGSFLNLLPVTVPPALRTALEDAVTVSDLTAMPSVPPELTILRLALTAAGFTDPYTGAPALSPALSALTDAIDKDVLQPLFGAPDPNAMVTPLEAGQLEGEVGSQVVLALTGTKEIEVALKAAGGLSLIKSITDLMAQDDKEHKPWLTDPAFRLLIASGVLYLVGLGSSAADRKIVAAIADWLSSALSTSPAIIQLSEDWAAPESPEKDKKVYEDILALLQGLALLAVPFIGMAGRGSRGGSDMPAELVALQNEHTQIEPFVTENQPKARASFIAKWKEKPPSDADIEELLKSADPAGRRRLANELMTHKLNDYIDQKILELEGSDPGAWQLPEDLEYTDTWLANSEQELKRLAYNIENDNYNFDELRTYRRGAEAGILSHPLARSWRRGYDIFDAAGRHWQVKAYGAPEGVSVPPGKQKTPLAILEDIRSLSRDREHVFIDLTNLTSMEWEGVRSSGLWNTVYTLKNVSFVDENNRLPPRR